MKPGCVPTKFACPPDREQVITGCQSSLQYGDQFKSPVHIKEQTYNMQHSDCQMETQCADQIKEESSCSESEECSTSKAVMLTGLYTNHMPEKPLCSDSTGCGVSEAEKLADELKEEALFSDGMECGMTGMSESAMLAGVDTDHDVKYELMLGSEHVKEEPSSNSEEYGMSEAAMLADLYADHVVKDELVLGPEHPHRPDVSLVVLDWALADEDGCLQESREHTSQPALKDCCVRLERLHYGAPAKHTIQDTTHTDSEPYSEDEMYTKVDCESVTEPVCDLCGKKFSLKSDLLKHVTTHIHTSSVEQKGSRPVVADYAFEEKPSKVSRGPFINRELALRDCCVRLERLQHHEALAGHDTAQDTTHIFEEKPSPERVLSRDSPLALRDCCVRLERIQHHEALASNDTAPHTTHTQTESDTENNTRDCKKELVCDLCGEGFVLKADLMRHVMIHIHVSNAGSMEPNNSQYKISTNVLKDNSNIDAHVCEICRKTFHHKYDLIRHIQNTHTQTNSKIIKTKSVYECNKEDKKTYPCDTCGIHFTQKVYLITHKRNHTEKRPYSCNICEKRFKTSGCLKIHGRVHTGVKPYSCEICQRKFAIKGNLVTHIRTHTGEKPYKCEMCNKRFTQSSALVLHRRGTHTEVKPYSCEKCDKQFIEVRLLNKHKKVHTGEKPYMCKICKKQFTNFRSLNMHKVSHTGITCEICKEHFTQWERFEIHKRNHTGGTVYTCALCSMKFVCFSKFNRHKRTHTNERPYACGICGKRYKRAGHLMVHNLYHTGVKPFSCKMCDKKFAEQRYLISHERIHTGEKPFMCEICKKRFTQKTHLNIHMRSHTGEKPYSCEMCNMKFRYLQEFKKHKVQCT